MSGYSIDFIEIDGELTYINPKNLHLYSNTEEMEEYYWMERNFPRLNFSNMVIAEKVGV